MRFSLIALAAAFIGTSAIAAPATYVLEPTHTYVTFEIEHMGISTNRARFDKKEGSVTLDREAKTGKLEVTIDANSVNSGAAAFDKHLQSADLFDTAKFPTIKFAGDKFTFNGDKVTEIAGTLTLLGKTGPVTLKATKFGCYPHPMLKREVCGGDFETVIDRSVWGLNYALQYGIPKEVRLVIQAEAVKQ